MKTRAIIIDDDQFAREELKYLLESQRHRLEIIGDFENPVVAIPAMEKLKPELLFLDIRMPLLNGFELLERFKKPEFSVIFVTSFDEYAIRAIRYSALDYLLKPISPVELKNALDRFYGLTKNIVSREKIKALGHNLNGSQVNERIVLPTRSGECSFAVNEIVRLEADSNYTCFHFKGNKTFVIGRTLKDFETILPENDFIRTHKSHLINKACISDLTSSGEVILIDGTRLPVARRKIQEVRFNLYRT